MCEDHKFGYENKSIKVAYNNGTSDTIRFRMQLFEDIGVSSTLNEPMMSHGLGSDRVLHHVCEKSREVIAGGFKSPEEVQEAERKVAEASKKLASKSAQTRKSAEEQRVWFTTDRRHVLEERGRRAHPEQEGRQDRGC